jgi:flagellar biosynthesis protein FliR
VLQVTDGQLTAFVAAFLWPFARVASLVAAAPVLGNIGVPRHVKLLLALALTVAVAPLVEVPTQIQPWSGPGLLVLAQQMLAGVAMGFTLRVVFTVVDAAGELTSLQMGLGFATFFDPQHGANTPVVAQFLGLLASLSFLAINGHLMMVSALAESFQFMPIGSWGIGRGAWLGLAHWGAVVFATGLMMALPVVVALLATNVALGILTRAAPQLNLFAVGFPVTILVGWVMLLLVLPLIAPLLTQAFDEGLRAMLGPLRGDGP